MELITNFLKTHSSTSLTFMSHSLEVPIKSLYNHIDQVLAELGKENFRIIYSIYTGRKIYLFSEKNKQEIEKTTKMMGRIYAIQRIKDNINTLYETELQQRDGFITKENKNEGVFIPIYSNTGGFPQERRQYSHQKKLNFLAIKKAQEILAENKPEPIKIQPFELEEESVIRCPLSKKIPFKKIADLQVEDMADIMLNDSEEVIFVGKIKNKKTVAECKIIDDPVSVPYKRTTKYNQPVVKRIHRESIIPLKISSKNTKLNQPSLASFFSKK